MFIKEKREKLEDMLHEKYDEVIGDIPEDIFHLYLNDLDSNVNVYKRMKEKSEEGLTQQEIKEAIELGYDYKDDIELIVEILKEDKDDIIGIPAVEELLLDNYLYEYADWV